MKNIIIVTLAPLALFGAYSLLEPATCSNNTLPNEVAPATATSNKDVIKGAKAIPETCVLDEDTFSLRSATLTTKQDPTHHNISVSREDHPKSSVTIKF